MPLVKIVRDWVSGMIRSDERNREFRSWPHHWCPDTDMPEDAAPVGTLAHDCPTGLTRPVPMRGGGASFHPDPQLGSFQPVLVGVCPDCRRVFLSAVFDFGEWEDFKKEVEERRRNEERG